MDDINAPRWRPQVRVMADAMEAKLRKHDAEKGAQGWQGDDPIELLRRVREETSELEYVEEHWCADGNDPKDKLSALLSEAADVANMAMMVVDVDGGLAEIHEEGQDDATT